MLCYAYVYGLASLRIQAIASSNDGHGVNINGISAISLHRFTSVSSHHQRTSTHQPMAIWICSRFHHFRVVRHWSMSIIAIVFIVLPHLGLGIACLFLISFSFEASPGDHHHPPIHYHFISFIPYPLHHVHPIALWAMGQDTPSWTASSTSTTTTTLLIFVVCPHCISSSHCTAWIALTVTRQWRLNRLDRSINQSTATSTSTAPRNSNA